MASDASDFNSLLLITILAVAVPVALNRVRRLRIPIVVGEIMVGILIGKSGFDLVEPNPILHFLAEFGFTFLMFLSGLEISMKTVLGASDTASAGPRWQRPLPLAFLMLGLTIAMATVVGYGVTAAGMARNPILMGLILSTTSLGIVVPILKERALTASLYGQTLLVSAVVADFVTLLLLSVVMSVLEEGFKLELLFLLALFAIFAGAARLSHWFSDIPGVPRLMDELSASTSQVRVRGAFAIMVIWVVLAEKIGVELILGAFMAGAIISAGSKHGGESPMRERLDAIGYGFFIPIFFINVGANFDFRALSESRAALLLVPILIAAAFAVKMLPALLLRSVFSWRETLAGGALLSSRLSLIIAAAAIALEREMIGTATNSAIILVAIITCTFAPLLFARILPQVEEPKRAGVVILGTDQLALLLAQRLQATGEKVVFIGRDQEQLAHLTESGFLCVAGSPEDPSVLDAAGLRTARALVAVSNDPALILATCRRAGSDYAVPTLIARADDPQSVPQLQQLGVTVVQPALATVTALEGALHFPAAFGMLMGRQEGVDLLDVPLRNLTMAGLPLRRVRLPGNALVLGIQRQGEVVVPHGDTVLRRGDILVLVGSPDALREAAQTLS